MENRKIKLGAEFNELIKALQETGEEFDTVNESIEAVREEIDGLKKQMEESAEASKKAAKGTESLKKGFGAVGTAIKAAGIGLVIGLLNTLKDVLMQNQAVADTFGKVFEFISLTFNQVTSAVMDALSAVNESTGGFDALKKVMLGLLNFALAPLKATFYGLKLGIQEVQYAWEKWIGDADPERLKELQKGIDETKQSLKDLATGLAESAVSIYENIGEAVGEVGQVFTKVAENVSEIDLAENWGAAEAIVDLRKQAELAAVVNQGLIEQYDRQAEQLRQIRDDERNGITARIEANEALSVVLEKQRREMLENANISIRLAELDYQKNQSQENQIALQEAINEKKAIEAQIEGLLSEQKANNMALERERQEIVQTGIDAELEARRTLEEAKINAIKDELAQIDARNQFERESFEESRSMITERLLEMEELGRVETQAYADLMAERTSLEAEYNAYVIENANTRAEKELEIEQRKTDAILSLGQMGLETLATFAEEGTDLAKGLAAAQIIFDTYRAIQATFATAAANPVSIAFPAFPFIQAGLAAAFGAAQLRNLFAADENTTTPPSTSGAAAAAAAVTPSVRVLQSNQTNSNLGEIAEGTSRPMRAYVTSGDVESSAQLERNIVGNALVGG